MTAAHRRFALRERTAPAHAALDAAVGPLDTVPAYERYLLGIHAFRAPVEAALAAAPDRPAPIAALVAADLEAAGIAPRPVGRFDLPEGRSALAGVAYVLEGSALGARLLHRQALALGRAPLHLAAQAAPSRAWAGFCARLEALDPFDADAAAGAALATLGFALAAFAAEAGDA